MMFADPVVGKDFFNRGEWVQLLLKRAASLRHGYRQNVAVLGPQLIGKSSLLQHFMLQFDDPETVVVYLELRQKESLHDFVDRYVTVFLHAFLKRVGQEVRGSESEHLQAFRRVAPRTGEWLEEWLSRRRLLNTTAQFKLLLELSSKTWKETSKFILFILDEFDRLLLLEIDEPFAYLGKEIMVQKETMYLLASSETQLAKRILEQRLSLLFGHFETITLGPFNPEEACEYLEERWNLAALEENTKQFLIFLTGGHPFYLNVLGQQLSTFSASELGHFSKSLLPVLEKALFNAQGILSQYFSMFFQHLMTGDDSGTIQTVLKALAKGVGTSQALRQSFKGRREPQKKLNRLLEIGVLSKNGVFYQVTDRLFAFWLRTCFEKKSYVLAGNISQQSSEFRQEAEETMKRFSLQMRQKAREKVTFLFESFNGEKVEIDQKSHLLPRFSKLHLMNGKVDGAILVGEKENGLWVSSLFEHPVEEEHVAEFLKQCKHLNRPIYQKILISLGGMSPNARLLAKKEKLWMWERENVNRLLDIFGHGPILTLSNGKGSHG